MVKKLLVLLLISLLISPIMASSNYIEAGHMEISITEPNFLQTFFNYFRIWDSSSGDTTQIGVSWVTYEKDLGGDLSKYYSPNSYKLFQAYQLGCTIKTEFVVKNTATNVNYGNIGNTAVYDMGGSNGWKAESMGYYSVPDGEYSVSAITRADCPYGVTNPMGPYDMSFYKSGTIQIGTPTPPPCAKEGESCGYSASAPECCSGLICKNFQCVTNCDVGSKCGEVYVELVCKDGDVNSKYEVWKYNSDCDCVFDSYWYNLDEKCDYGCTSDISGASCNSAPVCTAGWECTDSTHKAYKESDCTWSSVTNCANGCSNGECLSPKKSNGESCSVSDDCDSGNCLDEGVCGPAGTECWSNNGCNINENCQDGLCVLSTPKKSNGESCSVSDDCDSGNCLDEGVCGPAGTECWSNNGCNINENCQDGLCVLSTQPCTPHCEDFNWIDCENNIPVNKGILIDKCGVNCISDGDCLSDYVCDGYTCVEKVGWKGFGESCISNDECVSGNCLDSEAVCVPLSWVCYSEAGCASGYYCDKGECVEEIIPDNGGIDNGGVPNGLKPIGSTCYSDSECANHNCIENICVVGGIECITDAGCGINEVCSGGECSPVPEFPSWVLMVVGITIIIFIIAVIFLFLKK